MSKLLEQVKSMKTEEILEQIESIHKSWTIQKRSIYQDKRDNVLHLAEAIICEKKLDCHVTKFKKRHKIRLFKDGSVRGLRYIAIKKGYKEVTEKLIQLCTDAPTEADFIKLYPLVIELAEELYYEEKLIKEIFLNNQKYKEVKRGRSFINFINIDTWGASLFEGCKMYLLYKTNNKKLISTKFKNRSTPNLLMHIATAKHQGFTINQSRAYANCFSPQRYKSQRIETLYFKL